MKKKKESSPISIIISTIIYVILILILAFSLFANFNKKENQITTFFGYTFAVVQSGSMRDGGFEVGDMVIIKTTNTDTLKQNDIIVFYQYADPVDASLDINKSSLTKITDQVNSGEFVDEARTDANLSPARHDKDYAMTRNSMLVFHRIINVYVDNYNVRFFETMGDSNGSADTILIREDFICAKYLQSSTVLQAFFTFVASPIGLITVVLIPIMLMLIMQFFSFGKELKGNVTATKLLERRINYAEVDFEKYEVTNFLSPAEKVYLYDISKPEDKPNLAIILFDTAVEEVLKIYEKDRDEYYEYFSLELKKNEKNKLDLLHIKANIIHENEQITEDDANKKAKQIYKEKNSNATNKTPIETDKDA